MGKISNVSDLEKITLQGKSSIDIFKTSLLQLLEIEEESGQVTIGRAKYELLSFEHSLVAHAIENIRGAILLMQSKQLLTAMILARVALEHALYVQLIHLHPKGIDGIKSRISYSYNSYLDSVSNIFGMEKLGRNHA